jgi:uncharacterized membrane protein
MSTGFKILLVLHIIAAVAALGPLFVMASLQRADPAAAGRLYLRMCLPALVLVWVFGMGLVGASDDAFSMGDGWVIASLLVWVALIAVGAAVIRPALTARGDQARARLSAGLGTSHLLTVVVIYLMVFKPGA